MIWKGDNPMVAKHLLCKAVLLLPELHLALSFYSSLSILASFWSSHYILILQVLSPGAKNENHIEITISVTTLNWLSSGCVSILYWFARGTRGPGDGSKNERIVPPLFSWNTVKHLHLNVTGKKHSHLWPCHSQCLHTLYILLFYTRNPLQSGSTSCWKSYFNYS